MSGRHREEDKTVKIASTEWKKNSKQENDSRLRIPGYLKAHEKKKGKS